MYGEVDTATLEELTESENSLGEITESWSQVDTFPSRLSRLSGERRYESNKYTAIVEWRLYVDYGEVSVDLTNESFDNYRIKYDGITYKIETINNVDQLDKRYQIDLIRAD